MDKSDFDEYGVQRENTKLDNFLKRDSTEYMRLQGSEKTLFKERQNTEMYEMKSNGEYKRRDYDGTLVLTTRRLTFSLYSPRGRASILAMTPLMGSANYRYGLKEKDYIIFSYPTFLLLGKFINKAPDKFLGIQLADDIQWIIEDEKVKFIMPAMQEETIKNINDILSLELDQFIYKMMFGFKDTELYQKWDEFAETQDKEVLLNNLLKENNHFKFKRSSLLKKILQEGETTRKSKDEKENLKSPEKSIPKFESEKTFSYADELGKLIDLKEKGLLTDEEFSAAKAKLLNL